MSDDSAIAPDCYLLALYGNSTPKVMMTFDYDYACACVDVLGWRQITEGEYRRLLALREQEGGRL